MPIMGLGTYSLSDEECYNSVTALLEADGRLIDTAYMYGNEAAVGRAIRDSGVPREEILDIVVQGWYPFGGRGHTSELLNDTVISDIAASHGVTPAQVILRWNLQKGVVVIPGSSNPEHIRENLDLFDFSLTDDEMDRINALDRNEKHDWY